jgi:murein DD-endopeptidase MepM/ murein hydrolase activator NlpD/predicted negative regulator of RcsB-dependent stress response
MLGAGRRTGEHVGSHSGRGSRLQPDATEQLDPATLGVDLEAAALRRWHELADQAAAAASSSRPAAVVDSLQFEIASEPESPLASMYRLWIARAYAQAGDFSEALAAVEAALAAPPPVDDPMLSLIDLRQAALRRRATILVSAGQIDDARRALQELSRQRGGDSEALYEAGRLADSAGDEDAAAADYAAAAELDLSPRSDRAGELARRALARLTARPEMAANVATLAQLVATAVRQRDARRLASLASTTHFAVGPIGGHAGFEEPEALDDLLRDLSASRVRVVRRVIGNGAKRYVVTRGWRGVRFRGTVLFILTRTPRGWQWTGVGLGQPTAAWAAHWRPSSTQTNQPLPFELIAPWPAGTSFTAGGLEPFIAQSARIADAPWFSGLLLAEYYSLGACGFGTRGFYYKDGPTHQGEDAFAIDFTRYRRGLPFDNQSQYTPVLAPLSGVVIGVEESRINGDPDIANMVEVMHVDPATGKPRFMSRYLHLAGPWLVPVNVGSPVILGQRLGLMDDTGNSLVHHLHFSIHDQSVPFPRRRRRRSRNRPWRERAPDPAGRRHPRRRCFQHLRSIHQPREETARAADRGQRRQQRRSVRNPAFRAHRDRRWTAPVDAERRCHPASCGDRRPMAARAGKPAHHCATHPRR